MCKAPPGQERAHGRDARPPRPASSPGTVPEGVMRAWTQGGSGLLGTSRPKEALPGRAAVREGGVWDSSDVRAGWRHARGMTQSRRERAEALGAALKAARQQAGLSMEEVAEHLELGVEVLARVERGVMVPTIPTLSRLCALMKLDPDSLPDLPELSD
ncbi:helix-turn-helix transcriptional regulator [Corallococcus sp. AB049A]|uniref:helix-turn-helix domain-containing protein n=1 Tax=Corallococcus sp. AB049A TaxID=2316721 RepID=UPI00279527D5|nr:helix-turn-helix transcriptional regulator [Corallococcus sp. AB049A]